MKWKIIIGFLLLFPVSHANAQNPEIGIEVLEDLFFGGWTTAYGGWGANIRIIRGNNNMPERTTDGLTPYNDYWHAAKVRVYYISNGSSRPIRVTGIQVSKGDLWNETDPTVQTTLNYNVESYYWVEGTASSQFTLSPSNPEVIVYIGGAVQPKGNTPTGIYKNYAITVSLGYYIQY